MTLIRRARHSDAEAIIIAHERSIREVCAKDYSPEQIEAWAGRKHKASLWSQAMDRDFIWVLEIDSIVRGFGHLAQMDDETGEVMGLYFSPEARGLGIGKRLMKTMIDFAKDKGIKRLQLHSTLTARSFYETFGFKQVEGKCSIEMRGVDIPCYPMAMSISDLDPK